MLEMVSNGVAGVDEVVVDGIPVADDFYGAVGQHRDGPVRILVRERRLTVLQLKRIDFHE